MRWAKSWRDDPRAARIYDRHYSRRTVGASGVAPPGRPLVLLAINGRALWISHEQQADLQKHAWPGAWVCTVFRNEGAGLSSELIREACAATRAEWGEPPVLGMVTFIDEAKTRRGRSRRSLPGECFRRAGFVPVGFTKGGHGRAVLHVLQLPPPLLAGAAQRARNSIASLLGGIVTRLWWRGRLCAFDTETTAPDPTQARIVSAALVLCGGGEPTVTREWLVRPDVPIPPEATAIHGITDAAAQINGEDQSRSLTEICFGLARAWAAGCALVAMNAPYDLTVLDRSSARLGLGGFRVAGPVIDPAVLDKHVDKYRRGSKKLTDLCATYGARIDSAHNATADALAAARVAWAIGSKYPEVGQLTLEQLHRLQIGWYREQAEGLQAHWISKGDARRVDSFDWPVRRAA